MSNTAGPKNQWENKIWTVCDRCGQKIRLPVSYKPLQVTCPKCRNEFPYHYLREFGNDGEYTPKLQIQTILLLAGTLLLFLAGLAVSFAMKNYLAALFSAIACILVAIVLFDFDAFLKYLPIKILVINRQGIIYFNQEYKAAECLNWGEIKSAKYVYVRRMFAGLVEMKREPACIEFEISGKGKVRVPPGMFFNDQQRLAIIDEILKHYGSSRIPFGT